jgi:hypothetical protein
VGKKKQGKMSGKTRSGKKMSRKMTNFATFVAVTVLVVTDRLQNDLFRHGWL